MTYFRLIIPVILLVFISCADDSKKTSDTNDATRTNQPAVQQSNEPGSIVGDINFQEGTNPQPAAQPQRTPEPAQNADGVWHYTCPKGCKGGGGAAAPCASCGTLLAHNQGYHANAGTPQPQIQPQIQGTAGTSPVITPPSQANPEPAQNAAGVWHYTCSKGCAGGSGDRGATCAKCGGPLAHNKAYHN